MADLLAGVQPEIEELIMCGYREVHMRERVYPRWVEAGKMKSNVADNEIKAMREIVNVLEAVKERGFKWRA